MTYDDLKELYIRIWKSMPKWYRRLINRIDDPFDYIIQWLHCHKLPFGYQLNIAFIMKNRKGPYWPIIRKAGQYENCDPEDMQ